MSTKLPSSLTKRVFIVNLGLKNYLWPECLKRSTIAIHEDEDTWPFWLAGDREGYIAHCIATKKTPAGITPTRPVASRWFNLASIVSSTENDLWIHREKDELWWTISRSGKLSISFQHALSPSGNSQHVYVLDKPVDPWSDRNKVGNRLNWRALHPKAQDFLFTEATLQQLAEGNAAYARALINGDDLSPWHSRSDWKAKADSSRRNAATILNARQRSIVDMAMMARATVAGANGQQVLRTVKEKKLLFTTQLGLENYITALLEAQEGLCAITGLRLQFIGEHDDAELLCSLDRIDSDGHYEAGNLQVVCRFINRWKSNANDAEFRRLINLVRSSGGFD